MGGRGDVSLHLPHSGGMTREQAEAAAKTMVASLHRAGQRALDNAVRKKNRAKTRARKEDEAEILDRAVEFLQLDIGELKDRVQLLSQKGLSPRQIDKATELAYRELKLEEMRRRRLSQLEEEDEIFISSRNSKKESSASVVKNVSTPTTAKPNKDDLPPNPVAGRSGKQIALAIENKESPSSFDTAVELVLENIRDFEMDAGEALVDAKVEFSKTNLDGSIIDWTKVREAVTESIKTD